MLLLLLLMYIVCALCSILNFCLLWWYFKYFCAHLCWKAFFLFQQVIPKAEILRLGVLEQSKEEVIVQVSAKVRLEYVFLQRLQKQIKKNIELSQKMARTNFSNVFRMHPYLYKYWVSLSFNQTKVFIVPVEILSLSESVTWWRIWHMFGFFAGRT